MEVCSSVLIFITFSLHLTSADTHYYQYLFTGVTTGINFPEFTAVGILDGVQINYYDSNIKEFIPKTDWIKSLHDDSQWNGIRDGMRVEQETFKDDVDSVMKRFNHTGGVHTWQWMVGCELHDDNTTTGYTRYGYDGEDFISLDLTTLTYTAVKPQALFTKQNWDPEGHWTKHLKNYLDNDCVDWLKKYVSSGQETLGRKVRPEASVFQKHSPSPEVVCHATGFFPKALNITWQKDKEDVYENVELRETLPNQDGSFQKRSILKVSAEELQKHKYTCVIQHSSLEDDLVVELPGRAWFGIIGVIMCLIAVFVVWKIFGETRRQGDGFEDLSLTEIEDCYDPHTASALCDTESHQ